MSVITQFLTDLYPGPRQSQKALTLWPLLRHPGAPPCELEYMALADALEDGFVGVSEVSEDGSVPSIRVDNRAAIPVLVLFGEEIRGAKQNRVANASFLLAAEREVDIDVSCVEQGRWGRRARGESARAEFEGTADVLSSSLRRKMTSKVRLSLSRGERFDADQGEVWRGVSDCLESSGARSETMAYADYVGSRGVDLQEMTRAFHSVDGQVGFVAAIGDEVVGIEAIGRAGVFARVFPKLVRAYAIDAIDSERVRSESPRVRFDAPNPFLRAVAEAPVATFGPSLGLGEDLRLGSEAVEACALSAGGELVHVSAFPTAQ